MSLAMNQHQSNRSSHNPMFPPADFARHPSQASSSSADSDNVAKHSSSDDDADGQFEFTPAVVTTPLDDLPPMLSSTTSYTWSTNPSRSRGSLSSSVNGTNEDDLSPITPQSSFATTPASRQSRPAAGRTPSNAYAPYAARRPTQYSLNSNASRARNSSTNRTRRQNPNAEYRAQEKAYVQRIRRDAREADDYLNTELRTPSLDYSSDTNTDDGSPSTADPLDDSYEQDTLLYYGNDEMQPSVEELKIPENRERLEWHSMLANVLRGDVVNQEKKRLIGPADQRNDSTLKQEIWLGLGAKCCGRTLPSHRRLVENGRQEVKTTIETIIAFEIQGVAEAGKTPAEQVADMVKKVEKMHDLYPNYAALKAAYPRISTSEYIAGYDAIIAWHNTMELINTELAILRKWVGNDDLNFSQPRKRDGDDSRLADESTFIERLLKEDGLKSLQNDEVGLLVGLSRVISQAKKTLIAHAESFHQRHLPPYIEELQTLINFPSRLVKELIRIRLSYAKKIKDLSSQPVMTTEQMIGQFQILLELAVKIKDAYVKTSRAEPGWDPPDCIEENFDLTVLEALKFYFKLLNWKLSANKNAFKEAEIMEQEWGFSTRVGRYLDGGDVEVAEQFSSLTSKSLLRLHTQFEKELQKGPEELSRADIDKRYKTMLDSVRIRQRKLFRFSRLLTQRFENCAEFNISLDNESLMEFYNALIFSGHFLIESDNIAKDFYIIASPTLQERPQYIQSLLGTCYHAEDNPEDPSNPYVLILKPEHPLFWAGKKMDMDLRPPTLDVQTARIRLVADGSQQRLADAKLTFLQHTGFDLLVRNEQRANLPRVNVELKKIKRTAFNLSNAIMNSVEIIRKQTDGMGCQELIQACFAFATEFGQRSIHYMDVKHKASNNMRLMKLALDWISFICDDCSPSDRKTFRWAVIALEFAMVMTQGQNILSMSEGEYSRLRAKVSGCMALLVSHFDIMGARSTVAAQAEKQRVENMMSKHRMDLANMQDDEASKAMVRQKWLEQICELDDMRKQRDVERAALGRVLEDSNEALRALTYLSSSSSNVHFRWQQGQFVGGGTFGSVYVAINLETNELMAVKEIRLQDPQLIPTVVAQIRDEMTVLQVLDHPNIVSYYGIEPHRDKVYLFMEYCDGGSLAALLEHGRIEDETVIMVYALQMLEGLAYLHERSVVHRDIKPENILLDHDGVIKFVDFGAAKVIARQGGKTVAADHPKMAHGGPMAGGRQNSMQGTPMYMSPEVIRGSSSGRLGSADIWSLGCVILEMATGRRPWATLDNEWAIMYNIAQGNTPQLASREQLSQGGIDFLAKCFERDPSKRAGAAELLQDPWMMTLKAQLSLEPPSTPLSDSSGGSLHASRHNSMM